jgi:hypothetical protein
MRDAFARTISNVKGRVGGGNGGAVQLDRCFMTSGSDRFDKGMQSGGRDSPHLLGLPLGCCRRRQSSDLVNDQAPCWERVEQIRFMAGKVEPSLPVRAF